MNTITINDKDYTLNFGFDFLRVLDERYSINQNGVAFGFGVQHAVVDLQQKNPQKPSVEGIERFVEREAENGRLDNLFEDFFSQLQKQPLTRETAKRMLEAQEEA